MTPDWLGWALLGVITYLAGMLAGMWISRRTCDAETQERLRQTRERLEGEMSRTAKLCEDVAPLLSERDTLTARLAAVRKALDAP
jgi:hypothetical protein